MTSMTTRRLLVCVAAGAVYNISPRPMSRIFSTFPSEHDLDVADDDDRRNEHDEHDLSHDFHD